MDQGYFWLNDGQFEKLEPHLPTDTRGKPRVDDRTVISGIIRVVGEWWTVGGRLSKSLKAEFESKPTSIADRWGLWFVGSSLFGKRLSF